MLTRLTALATVDFPWKKAEKSAKFRIFRISDKVPEEVKKLTHMFGDIRIPLQDSVGLHEMLSENSLCGENELDPLSRFDRTPAVTDGQTNSRSYCIYCAMHALRICVAR